MGAAQSSGGAGGASLDAGRGSTLKKAAVPRGWPAVEEPHAPLKVFADKTDGADCLGAMQLKLRERMLANEYAVSLIGAADESSGEGTKGSKPVWVLRKGPGIVRRLRVADARYGTAIGQVERQLLSLAPIYRLREEGAQTDSAVVRKRLIGFQPTYDVFARQTQDGTAEGVKVDLLRTRPVMTASGSPMELEYNFKDRRQCGSRGGGLPWNLDGGESGARVAVARHSIGSILSGKDEYVVTLAPGTDPLLLTMVMAAIDDNESTERRRW